MYALTARHNSEAPAPPDFVHQGGGEIATDALAEHHDPPPSAWTYPKALRLRPWGHGNILGLAVGDRRALQRG